MITSILDPTGKEEKVREVAARLLEADVYSESFTTETQEEYDLLFDAVLAGALPDDFNLGRSGLWLRKKRINPPKAAAFH